MACERKGRESSIDLRSKQNKVGSGKSVAHDDADRVQSLKLSTSPLSISRSIKSTIGKSSEGVRACGHVEVEEEDGV